MGARRKNPRSHSFQAVSQRIMIPISLFIRAVIIPWVITTLWTFVTLWRFRLHGNQVSPDQGDSISMFDPTQLEDGKALSLGSANQTTQTLSCGEDLWDELGPNGKALCRAMAITRAVQGVETNASAEAETVV